MLDPSAAASARIAAIVSSVGDLSELPQPFARRRIDCGFACSGGQDFKPAARPKRARDRVSRTVGLLSAAEVDTEREARWEAQSR